MGNTRLIMFEGLPGTGKSSNSYFSFMQLERSGETVKWVHEVALPHPVLFFSEASLTYNEYKAFLKKYPQTESIISSIAVFRNCTVGIDLLELKWNHLVNIGQDAFHALQEFDVQTFPLDKYINVALEKWSFFTEKATEKESEVYILDSAIFQYQLFTFLLKNAPYNELKQFIQKLINIIKPLNPSLVYFYRENVDDTIDFLENLRGTQFMENIWERDKDQPYYSDKPKGAEGHRRFLRDYAHIAMQLFEMANCRKISIEISEQNWRTYEDEILSFLGTKRRMHPNVLPPNGTFRNESLGLEIQVKGLSIKDPNGTERLLTPKSVFEFYVECLPVILSFKGLDKIIISGGQICERWTTLGTQFVRV